METNQPQENTPIEQSANQVIFTPEKKSHGPLVGLSIIVILIVLGGIYFLKEKADYGDTYLYDDTAYQYQNSEDLQKIESQSSSDEISAIESDLQATNVDGIDSGFGNIESEFQAQ